MKFFTFCWLIALHIVFLAVQPNNELVQIYMEWFKNHADTIAILTMFAFCFWNLNEKINTIDKEMAIIKTVMIIKNILPNELAVHDHK